MCVYTYTHAYVFLIWIRGRICTCDNVTILCITLCANIVLPYCQYTGTDYHCTAHTYIYIYIYICIYR